MQRPDRGQENYDMCLWAGTYNVFRGMKDGAGNEEREQVTVLN